MNLEMIRDGSKALALVFAGAIFCFMAAGLLIGGAYLLGKLAGLAGVIVGGLIIMASLLYWALK